MPNKTFISIIKPQPQSLLCMSVASCQKETIVTSLGLANARALTFKSNPISHFHQNVNQICNTTNTGLCHNKTLVSHHQYNKITSVMSLPKASCPCTCPSQNSNFSSAISQHNQKLHQTSSTAVQLSSKRQLCYPEDFNNNSSKYLASTGPSTHQNHKKGQSTYLGRRSASERKIQN